MDIYTLVKLALLVVAVWFWTTIGGRLIRNNNIPWQTIFVASVTLVGFVYMQGWIA